MISKEKNNRYPKNLYLKGLIAVSTMTVTQLADKLNLSRNVINLTINGHYKGDNIVPRILNELGQDFLKKYKDLIPEDLHETLFDIQKEAN